MFGGGKAGPGRKSSGDAPKKKVKTPASIDEAKAMLKEADASDDPKAAADIKRVVCRKFPELDACKDAKKTSEKVSDNIRKAAGKVPFGGKE